MDEDYLYELLDYEEEDLNSDLHHLAEDTGCQLDSGNRIEFFYSNSASMICPIDGCEAGRFHSRAKYTRHWNERHVPTCIKYTCCICSISCRQRYDMKVHISRVHHIKNQVTVEQKTTDCKTVMENKGFIDPGFWVFKGRTTSSTTNTSTTSVSTSVIPSASETVSSSSVITTSTATCTSTSSVPCIVTVVPDGPTVISTVLSLPDDILPSDNTDFSVVVPPVLPVELSSSSSLPVQTIYLGDYRLRSKTESALTDVRKISNCSSSFGIKITVEESSQTASLELQPITLPPIPEQQKELAAYIRWLCLGIDQFRRQREAAKQKLGENVDSRLEKERILGRELETENRRLKREK